MSGWTAIVPVTTFHLASSRLDVPAAFRTPLAEAFVADTLGAVRACVMIEHVVVVTGDPGVRHRLARAPRTTMLEDRPLMVRDGQSRAVAAGAAWARVRRPDDPVVVLAADLPCLTGKVLEDVLIRGGGTTRAYVADTEGEGTTMLLAPSPRDIDPGFGARSARAHASMGYRSVRAPDPRARRDVDTVQHLGAARMLGLGPETASVLAECMEEDRSRARSGRRQMTPSGAGAEGGRA